MEVFLGMKDLFETIIPEELLNETPKMSQNIHATTYSSNQDQIDISFESVNTEFINFLIGEEELLPKTNDLEKEKMVPAQEIIASVLEDAAKISNFRNLQML